MKKFAVWEPALETAATATIVQSENHRQAAFVAASERVESIGHRSATLFVYDNEELRSVTVEPRTWYTVPEGGVSEPLPVVMPENDPAPEPNAHEPA